MNRDIVRRIIEVVSNGLIQGLILFVAAGTLRWQWAWALLLLGVVILAVNALVMPRELIAERGRKKEDAKKWDRTLTSVAILPMILTYVSCGLDYRFKWTGNVPVVVNILGLLLVFSGSMLFTWAMISNQYFSTMVRLQFDRQHTVATGGPYRYVRHPGYLGYIAMWVGTPIALGTLWALLFCGITSSLFIVRTILEDRTLREELPGYAEYAEKVKYRLVPGVW